MRLRCLLFFFFLALCSRSEAIYKNTAGQKLSIYAYDTSGEASKTGDAANITAVLSIDGGTTVSISDTNPTELDATYQPGIYIFDLLTTETNGNLLNVTADSSTANVWIEPVAIDTRTPMRGTDSAATASALSAHDGKLDTAQLDLDIITGADGTTLATLQGNYAPAKAGDAMNVTEWNGAAVATPSVAGVPEVDITHIIGNAGAAASLKSLTDSIVTQGTAQGPGADNNQIQLAAGEPSVSDIFDPAVILLVGGTGSGQSRRIIEYDGSTKIAVVSRTWKTTPDNTTEYAVFADPGGLSVNEGLAQAGASMTITLNSLANDADDAYNGQTVFIVSGAGEDQARVVWDYDGTTKIATVNRAWDTQPDSTSGYLMLPMLDVANIEQIGGDDQSALDLKDFVDNGYTPGTNSVLLVDTVTVNTDLAPHDAKLDVVDATVDAIKVVTDVLFGMVEDVTGYRWTTKALEQAPSGSGGDATEAKQDLILADLVEIEGTGFTSASASLKAIRDRGDAAWITGGTVAGAYTFEYWDTDTSTGKNIPNMTVWATTDALGTIVKATGITNALTDTGGGTVALLLAPGTYYIWRSHPDYSFTNPDTQVQP